MDDEETTSYKIGTRTVRLNSPQKVEHLLLERIYVVLTGAGLLVVLPVLFLKEEIYKGLNKFGK